MLSQLLFVFVAFGAVAHALVGLIYTRPFIFSLKFHRHHPIRMPHTGHSPKQTISLSDVECDQHENLRIIKLKYFGDGVNGNIYGHGKLIYPNGDVYEGSFVDNKRHGQGVLTYGDGKHLLVNSEKEVPTSLADFSSILMITRRKARGWKLACTDSVEC